MLSIMADMSCGSLTTKENLPDAAVPPMCDTSRPAMPVPANVTLTVSVPPAGTSRPTADNTVSSPRVSSTSYVASGTRSPESAWRTSMDSVTSCPGFIMPAGSAEMCIWYALSASPTVSMMTTSPASSDAPLLICWLWERASPALISKTILSGGSGPRLCIISSSLVVDSM